MEGLFQDLRYGWRVLLKNPGFTTVAVLTLALGVGANSAIFSVMNAVLLRPLPYERPSRLVHINESNPQRGLPQSAVSTANFLDWRTQNKSFSTLAADSYVPFNFTSNSGAVRLDGVAATANFFDVFGIRPILGRTFLPDEEPIGHDDVIVISETLWRRQFGTDPAILHRMVTMNGHRFAIVGVMPGTFKYPFNTVEVWKPLGLRPDEVTARSDYNLDVVGRLRDGVTIDAARAEMDAISKRLEHDFPTSNAGVGASLQSLHEFTVGGSQAALFVLQGAVLLVLLIACVNVASLLAARFNSRRREVVLRSSLGATRGRLIRQFLTETALLSLAGGGAGLLLAQQGLGLLLHFLPPGNLPRTEEIALDWRVLLFTLLLSTATGLLFGLAPAWQGSRTELSGALRESGRGVIGSRTQRRFQAGLIVAEIALSVVALVGAGLMLRSFVALRNVDPGFRIEGVLVNSLLVLPDYKYPQNYQRVRFFRELIEKARTMPGVKSAGGITALPLQGNSGFSPFRIEGRAMGPRGEGMSAVLNVVTPDYFATVGIPMKGGRVFRDSDDEHAPRVAVVNDVLAKRFFGDRDPIGQRLYTGADKEPLLIVGVVGSSHQFGLDTDPQPEIFTHYLQAQLRFMYVLVRSDGNPDTLIPAMRNAVASIDRDQPVGHRTLEQQFSNAIAGPRLFVVLVGLFAAIGLLLATVGVYGVMAYTVEQRTHEIGIRMALGAGRDSVLRLFLGDGMRLTGLGLMAGMVLAIAAGRGMSTILFGVGPADGVTFAGVPVLLAGVAVLATYVPARRATRVDPMVALRYE